jgi:hypothetical protein
VRTFQRWRYPIQTLLGIAWIAVTVVGVAEAKDERDLFLRGLLLAAALVLTMTTVIGWIITSRERQRPG